MAVKVREKAKGSGEWWVFIDHQGRRKSKKVGDKRLAKQVSEQIDARLKLGDVGFIHDKKQNPVFSEYVDRWITTVVPATCKHSTQKDYKLILLNHVLPVLGDKPITDINRLMVKEFLMKKLNEGFSQSTVNHIKNCISGVLNLAIDDEIIENNPAQRLGKSIRKNGLNKTKRPALKIDPLSREELSLLLQTFKEKFSEHYPFVLTLSRTGIRLGEALALQWRDVDFNERFITIQRSIVRGRIETPKNGKYRRVDMSMQLTEVLWKLKRERLREMGDNIPEWMFVNEVRKPLEGHNWRKRVFYKVLDMADMRRIRIHDLRHTYASLLLQAGESMAYIRDQLGHHSIKVTVDIYGHLVPGGNKDAVDRLDDVIETAPIRTLSAPKANKDSRQFS